MPDITTITNENGTTAFVSYDDDSASHDSSYVYYHVYLKFDDNNLNPPYDDLWNCGGFDCHYKQFTEKRVMEVAQEMYDFLMNFRTSYGMEKTINEWKDKYEKEHQEVIDKGIGLQTLNDLIFEKDARINELQTDYVKDLERQIEVMKQAIDHARKELLKIAGGM